MKGWLKPRANDANKGSFGHVLVIGGDYGMPGAVRIAAEGALRVGAGLVTVITHPEHVAAVVSGRPELLCYGLESPEDKCFKTCLSRATMLVLGPGLGQTTWSKAFFNAVISERNKPLLLDADALNQLAQKPTHWKPRADCILTPHPGEAARLLGVSVDDIQADRTKAVEALQTKYGGVVVLKGARSLVCTEAEAPNVCLAGNPGMASAGMGDLLSGIIAGLVAQGLTPWQATQMGVLLHASAGDASIKRQGGQGVLASDLLRELPDLLRLC